MPLVVAKCIEISPMQKSRSIVRSMHAVYKKIEREEEQNSSCIISPDYRPSYMTGVGVVARSTALI